MEPTAAKPPKKATSKKGKAKARDHAALMAAFETSVLDGSFPVGKLFKAAVQRQKDDLARPDFGFKFDLDTGLKAVRFIEQLQHVEGPLAGEKIVLAPWQIWFVAVSFGWVNSVSGYPRYRRITLYLPKGQGKTILAAAIATYILATDKTGARVVSAATTREQARLSFQNARLMLLRDPELATRFGLEVEEHKIAKANGAIYRPMSSEATSVEGLLPRLVVLDELHAHATRTLYDNLRSSAAKRPDSQTIVISTAGFDQSPGAIGWEVYCYARDILKGNVQDDSQFSLLIEMDEGDDPWVESTWRKANPNMGISIDPIEVANEAKEAQQIPSKRNSFMTKRLGVWSESIKQFISAEAWDKCYDPTLNPADFLGQSVSIGLDLALTRDLTAKVLIHTRLRDDGQREYAVWGKGYLPEESITLKNNKTLINWAEEGYLILTPGEVMDFGYLREDLKKDMQDHPGSEPCVDPWGAPALIQDLASDGIPVIEVRQGARTQSGPMKEIEAATLSKRLRHDGSPLMRWCMLNLIAAADRNGNIAPDKESDDKKIDLGVAMINGMVRASVTSASYSNGPSFLDSYEDD